MASRKWLAKIVEIENRGYAARMNGEPITNNPYQAGRNNLQRLRKDAYNHCVRADNDKPLTVYVNDIAEYR